MTQTTEKIIIDREVFAHLPADVKIDALLLRKLGRLMIVDLPKTSAGGSS